MFLQITICKLQIICFYKLESYLWNYDVCNKILGIKLFVCWNKMSM